MVITTRERQIKQYKAVAKKERKKGAKIVPVKPIIAVALMAGLSACSGTFGQVTAHNHGKLTVEGNREVVAEIWKGLNGLVVTGKAKPNVSDAYFLNQDAETQIKKYEFVTMEESNGQ